jgi:hypothetical protein
VSSGRSGGVSSSAPARRRQLPGAGGAGQAAAAPLPRVRVGSPAGVLAVVPHLLGFHPSRSFVVLGLAPPRARVKLGFRYDLPDPPDAEVAEQIAGHATAVLARQRITTAILVGYGPGHLVTPVADALRAAAGRASLTLREVLRADGGRYWSYLCREPACCPAEGVAYDSVAHPAAAALVAAGLAAYPDRATLARTLAPVTGAAAESMARATELALGRVAELLAKQRRSARGGDVLRLVVEDGRRAVSEAISAYRAGDRLADDDQIAWLSVALADLRVRDDAWARMDPDFKEAHQRMWADIVRRASPAYVPAPASLLAFTAWQAGDGTLANIAIERAMDADPQYSMALLLSDVIEAGVPPSEARLPMTPEEVAESYAQADPGS